MSWPPYLLKRAVRPPDLSLGVVPGSTPVVAFGDPVESWVATLGINPSSGEFLDASGSLLDGSDRRLATLRSLGVDRYEDLTADHAEAIVDDCASYFDRRPYRWFTPLNDLIHEALGVSYAARSACHLDLVQWATRPLWGELPADVQDELLRHDVGFLRTQLNELSHKVVIVNGKSVMSWVERSRLVRWQPVCTLDGPPTTQFSVAQVGDTRFLGWTCNLQSQHGAMHHAPRLVELVAEHSTIRGPVGRQRAQVVDAPPRPAREPVTPTVTRAVTEPGHVGPTSKGLHFTHKSELVSYLATWLQRSSYETVGDVGTYGGSVWITVDSQAGPIGINRDTSRDAVEALVATARTPRGYDWMVVANQKGRINRVLFSEDKTPGWYAYLREPLDHETQLGAGQVSGSTPGAAPPARSPGAAVPQASPSAGRPSTAAAADRPQAPPERAAIVQFPHPGGEHVPSSSHMAWNRGGHARKFLTSPGTYVDADDTPRSDQLVFWGEWEAQSRVVHRWDRRTDLPTVLHEPYWATPTFDGDRQNTDPWVFGDTFLYSNCKQLTPARSASAMQRLPIGSVILFGSGRGGEFVLDTMFVVGTVAGSFSPFEPATDLGVDDAFATCTLESLGTLDESYATATYTLFRGATPASPVNGTYSFTPCRPRGHNRTRFARPVVQLPGIVNPLSTQSPSGANDLRPADDVTTAWHEVVRQVRMAGLDLAVKIETPPYVPSAASAR